MDDLTEQESTRIRDAISRHSKWLDERTPDKGKDIIITLEKINLLDSRESNHDDINPNIYNKKGFFEIVERDIKLLKRDETNSTHILFIDLDGFKKVNDEISHTFGDSLLGAVGEVLDKAGRDTDVPARLRGDEFAYEAVGSTADDARQIGLRLREVFETVSESLIKKETEKNIRTSLSFGVAELGEMPVYEEVIDADGKRYNRFKETKKIPRSEWYKYTTQQLLDNALAVAEIRMKEDKKDRKMER